MTFPDYPAGDPQVPDPYAGPPPFGPPGYAPPGYAPPGYAPPGYATGYPPQPPYATYPQPGYQPYRPPPVRPTPATAGPVLAFINSGLLLMSGLLLVLGASLVSALEDASQTHSHFGTEVGVDAVVNLVAAGLLIGGGVQLLSRKTQGRGLLVAGNVLVLVEALYWAVRFSQLLNSGFVAWTLIFTTLAAVSLAMTLRPDVARWLT